MKKFLAIWVALFACSSLSAQIPQWTWANQIGGPGSEHNGSTGYDGGHTCVSDAQGNVYVGGNFESGTLIIGPDTLHTNGVTDFFIAKYDSAGVAQWARKAGGSSNDIVLGVGVDTSGNIYVCGEFQSSVLNFGTIALNNTANGNFTDLFIAKYDENGTLLWARSAGTSTNDAARSIAVTADGYAYITGLFGGSTITFGSYTLTNNYFLTKYDSNGNVVWAKGAGSNSANAYGNSIDGSGNIYVTGLFYATPLVLGSITLYNDTNTGTADIFVVKYDSAGNELWAKRAGGWRPDMAYSIFADAAGNAFVTGGSYSSSFPFGSGMFINATNSGNNTDIYVLQYDANGNEVMVLNSTGATGNDQCTSVCTDTSGNIYITGHFASNYIHFGSTQLANTTTGNQEAFIAKFSPAGTPLWAKRIGGIGNDIGKSVASNIHGDLYASGHFGSNSISGGNFTFVNFGFPESDMYLAKISAPNIFLPIEESHFSSGLSMYPNPTNNVFTIVPPFPDDAGAVAEVYSADGRLVMHCHATSGLIVVDLTEEENGVYFVRIVREGVCRTGRIVKLQ